jgi:chromosome segregation ATPase
MDINQTARMIEWLDEERRRDKATIARLEERFEQQQEFIETLTRKLGSLENEHSATKSQFLPVGRDIDMLDLMRSELHQSIEAIEARRVTAEREADRRTDLLRETIARQLRDNAERIEAVSKEIEELPAARVERDRIASILSSVQQRMDDLSKKFEEPERRITFLEEQRRQDSRRLSEVQTEMPELQKQFDTLRPKLDLLEELALRNEKRITEGQSLERERREQMQAFVDQQTLLLQQRDQKLDEITRNVTRYDDDMKRNMERFETWAEAYRQMKKLIEDFERMGDRLERRINEVAEMQRLAEERFRQEWNGWIADDQKRWKTFTLTNDETWRQHDKDFDMMRVKIVELQNYFPPLMDSVDRVWKLMRAQADLYRDRYQALIQEYDAGEKLPAVRVGGNGNGSRT